MSRPPRSIEAAPPVLTKRPQNRRRHPGRPAPDSRSGAVGPAALDSCPAPGEHRSRVAALWPAREASSRCWRRQSAEPRRRHPSEAAAGVQTAREDLRTPLPAGSSLMVALARIPPHVVGHCRPKDFGHHLSKGLGSFGCGPEVVTPGRTRPIIRSQPVRRTLKEVSPGHHLSPHRERHPEIRR